MRPHDLGLLLAGIPVIPVLVIERVEDATPIAEALVSGGLKVLEVTLRTKSALAAVTQIRRSVPQAVVGVGSVIDATQFAQAQDAGARFAVSPGASEALHAAADAAAMPWLPGAQSISEVLALRERGFRFAKFFPADYSGGVRFLRALSGPIPDMRFCPTGGISAVNAPDYLALNNVPCVGGSWLTPEPLLAGRQWDELRSLARQAFALAPSRGNGNTPPSLRA